ncbi:MAG TPA: gluconolactonase [Dehalococcoidia bacterium]|mgnify:FL=1|nr:gluconolactonase [Chloroflexota bacterium]HCI86013.1 gluconolactonase [Dehalococcoidia bacterium]|tara:strand:- start:1010 stop:1897 length:888 start_codon:yes stop_codon:yes gene_type:complete
MSVKIREDRFRHVVGDNAIVEQVATGFIFTEGAMWKAKTGELIFSDMPGDIVRKWSEADGITTYRQPSDKQNGHYFDLEGRLLSCSHSASNVSREERDGSISILASHYNGRELNSPNDIIVKSDGTIYFSDPTYGRMEGFGLLRDQDLDFQGVYRIDPETGELSLLVDDFDQPNGLTFSIDEKLLYINDTDKGHIRVFDVANDGSISGGEVWAVPEGPGEGGCDGMKTDSEDNVYCAGPGGIHVYAPDATSLGVIQIPEVTANFTWGDDDLKTLYITASTSLYRTRVNVPGPSIS